MKWYRQGPLLVLLSTAAFGAFRHASPSSATGGVAVRHTEGTVHGFLRLSTAEGAPLADGDLLQVVRQGTIDSRMVFAFIDGSTFEEVVSFTQQGVFTMLGYRLIQRGPAFPMDLDVTLSQGGEYQVIAVSHDGKREEYKGKLELPADTYNGMIINVAKNLPLDTARLVHLVAFTPKPRLIGLEMRGGRTERPTAVGQRAERTVAFTFAPKLGALIGTLARLTGKMPPKSHAWFITQDVPAFVRFEGPLYDGPAWRLDLIGPTLLRDVPLAATR